jgi:hypothetical protein
MHRDLRRLMSRLVGGKVDVWCEQGPYRPRAFARSWRKRKPCSAPDSQPLEAQGPAVHQHQEVGHFPLEIRRQRTNTGSPSACCRHDQEFETGAVEGDSTADYHLKDSRASEWFAPINLRLGSGGLLPVVSHELKLHSLAAPSNCIAAACISVPNSHAEKDSFCEIRQHTIDYAHWVEAGSLGVGRVSRQRADSARPPARTYPAVSPGRGPCMRPCPQLEASGPGGYSVIDDETFVPA